MVEKKRGLETLKPLGDTEITASTQLQDFQVLGTSIYPFCWSQLGVGVQTRTTKSPGHSFCLTSLGLPKDRSFRNMTMKMGFLTELPGEAVSCLSLGS